MTNPTPSPELVQQWTNQWHQAPVKHVELEDFVATQSARWGADQELEACCEWVANYCPYFGDYPMPEKKLRAARRPPPSLKEQALQELERIVTLLMPVTGPNKVERFAIIRRALEQLDD